MALSPCITCLAAIISWTEVSSPAVSLTSELQCASAPPYWLLSWLEKLQNICGPPETTSLSTFSPKPVQKLAPKRIVQLLV